MCFVLGSIWHFSCLKCSFLSALVVPYQTGGSTGLENHSLTGSAKGYPGKPFSSTSDLSGVGQIDSVSPGGPV